MLVVTKLINDYGAIMLWDRARKSDNVQDRRTGGGKAGLSLGGIAVIVVMGLISGQDPMQIFGNVVSQAVNQGVSIGDSSTTNNAANDKDVQFLKAILGDTEDTWREIFRQSNQKYQDPQLIVFSNSVSSACGSASSASGPFYCPGDKQVYIDLSFFREMQTKFNAAGDFAKAYVIAHEVGHHVQTLLGVSTMVNNARRSGQKVEGDNGLLVRQELQADCFAGVWANSAQKRLNWLEYGDIDSALNAANAIGDDALQKKARGYAVPDSFTHGTSAQRVKWFKIGFEDGNPSKCDTFNAVSL